jgi:ribosome biogenesis ATPase
MPFRQQIPRVTLGQGLDKEVGTDIFRNPLHTSSSLPVARIASSFTLLITVIQVYQVVRKIVDEDSQYGGALSQLTTSVVYDSIKRSNSSLNRKSKKLLIDSIERVLAVSKDNERSENDDSLEDGDPMQQDAQAAVQVDLRLMLGFIAYALTFLVRASYTDALQESNAMNRSLVGMWAQHSSSNPKSTHQVEPALKSPVAQPSPLKKRQSNGEPLAKRRKPGIEIDRSPPAHVSLADLGGVDTVIQELEDLIVLPLLRPEIYVSSRIQPPRGVLLHGPPGCGKTMIANAFAAELGVPFIAVSAPSIVSGMSGESEKALRDHFEEAKKMAPCLMFIDEIDAITPKRESAQREMEKRIVAQLLTCMDDLAFEKTDGKSVIVLAATNRPDSLDPALRRGGRFDKEINLSVPNEAVREQILKALTRQMQVTGDLDFRHLAKLTPGFVGADLNDLVSTAGSAAIKRFLEVLKNKACDVDMESNAELSLKVRELRALIKSAKERAVEQTEIVSITNDDFLTALPKIQPSSKREGFATIPDTTWADIGALGPVREELLTAIVDPIKSPEKYQRVGITAPTGVLLWGPPGCGKTLLAKAVANKSRANFISVKGPELLNKYVGESERAVRQVFVRARSSVPCVIFFDELDALVPRRDESLSEASARVVNTLLTELDGLSSRAGIYVIAATNRPDIIDPAMLRPGRLETLLLVDLPGPEERVDILRTLVRKLPIYFDVTEAAMACEGFSGADLESLVRRAGYAAIKRGDDITSDDLMNARAFIRPSVGDQRKYAKLKEKWGKAEM